MLREVGPSVEREPWARAVERLRLRVPVLDRHDEVVVGAFTLAWSIGFVAFVAWWFEPDHVVTPFRHLVTTAVLAVAIVLPLWLFTAARRMRQPSPRIAPPDLRVAMVVTKSPGEPWPVVERTLLAMLGQDHRGPYDVWLADERPSDETLRWCEAHGVRVSSRADQHRYHRSAWPRRTRCKEGNLAYFYDTWGYDRYDVVAQFDADHVPEPDYLQTVMRSFADPGIGYVAAPSICDANASRSWAARGRLHREATLHGPVQAGQNDGMAPTCIGSHYAVRTQALRDVGGIGPELAEDFSTSFIMNACGWRGAFALDAIAHGDGPETYADAMVQELQWSRSLQVLLLRYCRPLWTDLPARERWKLRFALWWYPMFAAQLLVGFLLPPIALLTATPWVEVNLVGFLVRTGLMSMVTIGFVLWLRDRGLLRPVDAKVVGWESMLFQVSRWPWVLVGVVQGTIGALTDRSFEFKVTPKGDDGSRGLPLLVMVPHLALVAIAGAVVLVAPEPGRARGYYLLVLAAGATYAVVAWAIPLLHARENPRLRRAALLPHLGAAATVTTLLVGAAALRWDRIAGGAASARAALDPAGAIPPLLAIAWLAVATWLVGYAWHLKRRARQRAGLAAVLPTAAAGPSPEPVDRPALITLARVAATSPAARVEGVVASHPLGVDAAYRSIDRLLASGHLVGDLGGRDRGGRVLLTAPGRAVLAAALHRRRPGTDELLDAELEHLAAEGVAVLFRSGRPAAPTLAPPRAIHSASPPRGERRPPEAV